MLLPVKVTVITISDRAFQGIYEDLSGPEIERILREEYPDITIERVIVPDTPERIEQALLHAVEQSDCILTTGGTGIGPRDNTPEVTKQLCEKELPGISEALRAASLAETPMAMLSRGYAGVRDSTIIINFPGSLRAVTLCTKVVLPIISHATAMFRGEGH